jgi:hypothetical protein
MKRYSSTPQFMPMSKDAIALPVAEVRETLASGFALKKEKTFGQADVWNICRSERQHGGKRFLM